MKIYLIQSKTGKIHLATKIYLHDGAHKDVLELTVEGYNKIRDKMYGCRGQIYRDSHGNEWFLRNYGIEGEVYLSNGIKNIKELYIKDMESLVYILKHKQINAMHKVRLLEKIKLEELK